MLRTEKQKIADKRNERIAKSFVDYRKKEPEASKNRIIVVIAQKENLDRDWVRRVLIKKGVYYDGEHTTNCDTANANQ